MSLFRYSAWEWSEIRKEYYLHQCIIQQPDLNYRNPKVVKEMQNVLKFWLDKGVDGFRIDAIPYIFETIFDDGTIPDEPVSGLCDDPTQTCYLDHIYTKDLQETYDLVYSWRKLMDEYKQEHGGDTRILMTEAYTSNENMIRFYGNSLGERGAEIPFNFIMINDLKSNSTTQDYKDAIDQWVHNMPKEEDYVPNWVLGNHDNHRVINRLGLNRADSINMMLQTLPGIAITYYGEELGMADQWISWNDTKDPQACLQSPETYDALNRDVARTPMQWDDSRDAGFSTSNKTWFPVADNYTTVNVKSERWNASSHLNVFKRLILLRNFRSTLQDGSFESIADRNLLVFKREVPGAQLFVILNFGTADQDIRITDYFGTLKILYTAVVVSGNSRIPQG